MKNELFKLLDAMYDFMNPALRHADKDKWKEDTWNKLSEKSEAEQKEWIELMWGVINYKE